MSTRKILTLASMVALSFAPAAFCAEPLHVVGEKLDSGLSDLSASYAATEYQRPATGVSDVPDYMATEFVWIPMRSKVADVIPDMATQFLRIGKQLQSIEYTAAEFQRGDALIRVVGEKLDSGLSDLPAGYTAAEFQKQVIGQKLDSGLGELPADYTAAEFQKQIVATH